MVDTKILIGVPTAEMARGAEFYDHFNALDKPLGTGISFAHGQSPARNRNLIIRMALDKGFTHIFFLDDDVAFERTLMMDLLKHDKDIVGGLYFMRSYPHTPIAFDYTDETGRCRTHYLSDNETGLIEVVAMGLGCCLIKTEVFKKLEEPWIRLGELERDHWCDDIGFFKRVREAGFKSYCDLDSRVGHMAHVTIWPTMIDGRWMSTYQTNGTKSASVYQVKKPESVEVEGDSRNDK